jgi:hypothetical protein
MLVVLVVTVEWWDRSLHRIEGRRAGKEGGREERMEGGRGRTGTCPSRISAFITPTPTLLWKHT